MVFALLISRGLAILTSKDLRAEGHPEWGERELACVRQRT
jgi:hypothetical protein